MAKSTARHERERAAQIAKSLNISAELIRRARIINQTFSDGEQLLASGEVTVNQLYKLAKGESRAGLHILIPRELRDRIKQAAKERSQTVNDMLGEILTQIFW